MSREESNVNGTLEVRPIAGRELREKELVTKQAPFLEFYYGHEKRATKADKRGGRKPEWNDVIRFAVQPGCHQLFFKAFAASLGENKFIGEGIVELDQVLRERQHDGWFELKASGKYAGEVYLELTFFAPGEYVAPPVATNVRIPKPVEKPVQYSGSIHRPSAKLDYTGPKPVTEAAAAELAAQQKVKPPTASPPTSYSNRPPGPPTLPGSYPPSTAYPPSPGSNVGTGPYPPAPSSGKAPNVYPPVSSPTPSAAYPPTTNAAYPPSSVGAAYPPSSAGPAYPPSSVGAAYPPSSAGAAYPPSTAGATHPPSTAGAAYPPSTAGSAYPPTTAGSVYPPSTAGAAYPPSTASAAYPPSKVYPPQSTPPTTAPSAYPPKNVYPPVSSPNMTAAYPPVSSPKLTAYPPTSSPKITAAYPPTTPPKGTTAYPPVQPYPPTSAYPPQSAYPPASNQHPFPGGIRLPNSPPLGARVHDSSVYPPAPLNGPGGFALPPTAMQNAYPFNSRPQSIHPSVPPRVGGFAIPRRNSDG
jgi:hypothetical protein